MRVYVFGDSIAAGFFDTDKAGWVSRISAHYQQEALKDLESDWVEVFNLGVAGDTVEGVLKRLKPEIEARRLTIDEECIVIAVGINDSILRDNIVVTEVDDFQKKYEKLIDEALKLCPRVICVGLTSVKESEADPWTYSASGKQWKNNRINLFEDAIKQSSILKEVAFIPVHDAFNNAAKESDLLADGLHPNIAGHEFIARNVLAAIEALR